MAPDQKYYDAMLIRAYRRFMTGGAFAKWVKETFGVWPSELPLKRCKGFYTKQGVRAFVGAHLRPLADRLLDSEPSDDIETLRLLQGKWAGLDCQLRRDRSLSRERARFHRNETLATKKSMVGSLYDAWSPNRKGLTMVKVPQGRSKC
jgi:hypothetical protein